MTWHAPKNIQLEFHLRADAKRFFNRLENPWIRRKEDALAQRLASLCPVDGHVLEVGCGEGSNLHYLKKQLPWVRFTGVDFSQAKVDFADKLLPGMDFRCADALALPFPDASFDFVFCRDLLHHVDFDRQGVLCEMKRVLKTGGMMAVYEGRGRAPLSLIFQIAYPAERGLWRSTPETSLKLARQYGRSSLDFAETSFCIRTAAFFLGWPRDAFARKICFCVYSVCGFFEKLLAAFVPRRFWAYMLLTIKKELPL